MEAPTLHRTGSNNLQLEEMALIDYFIPQIWKSHLLSVIK